MHGLLLSLPHTHRAKCSYINIHMYYLTWAQNAGHTVRMIDVVIKGNPSITTYICCLCLALYFSLSVCVCESLCVLRE